ncbi:nudix family protein, putative [Ichthyophthirius multifiliis]|uniref:Nudix family protein, putative n=1 Tax=Ichthyophthirius multifiliis TaxID=5932 RepID=G0QW22_ICHMU|nr:nudix family protein, putative [Ichthyophthirius multifiliis]EGR30586.1 nudix family protein, putative [Ichthyophthirius multifiliis]|eukprot:XP_004032173.1 nudix family protein, putative [Ichthyophthirius multifiliis]
MHQGNWLKLSTITYKNENGQTIPDWETVERTTRKPGQLIDGVEVIPIVRYKNKQNKILLIANFRPPVNGYVIEFPAGLLDSNNLFENAIRELKEETGYIAEEVKMLGFSPPQYTDPWKSNECGQIVWAFIDGDREENQNPKQELEKEENIHPFLVDLDENIIKNIQNIMETKNYLIEQKIYMFLLGLQFKSLII